MSHDRPAVSRRLRLRAAVALGATVLLAASCASSHHGSKPAPNGAVGGHETSSAPAGATVTKTRIFAPYGRSGTPAAGVVAHRSGSCFAASITVAGHGAYRCFAANKILDPCFTMPSSTRLLDCYASPWSRATQLKVTHLPAANGTTHVSRPWAVELQGGARCVVTNGTATIVRHVALGYRCPDGAAGLIDPDAGGALKAMYKATDGLVRTVLVRTAWQAA